MVEVDFNGVHCDVLKQFMECDNLRNIEVLSFMSERGVVGVRRRIEVERRAAEGDPDGDSEPPPRQHSGFEL